MVCLAPGDTGHPGLLLELLGKGHALCWSWGLGAEGEPQGCQGCEPIQLEAELRWRELNPPPALDFLVLPTKRLIFAET